MSARLQVPVYFTLRTRYEELEEEHDRIGYLEERGFIMPDGSGNNNQTDAESLDEQPEAQAGQ